MAQGHELKLNMYKNELYTVALSSALLFARNFLEKKQQQQKNLVVQHLHWGSNLKAENDSDWNFLDASVGVQISAI